MNAGKREATNITAEEKRSKEKDNRKDAIKIDLIIGAGTSQH